MKITDEMLLDALNAYQRTDHEQCGIKRGFVESTSLSDWADENVEKMRAALAAALSRAAAVPDAATELRAERDAALAAIERVRAPGDDDPFSDIYQSRENLAEQETGIAWGDEQLVRRRKAGPWLPVEGESK